MTTSLQKALAELVRAGAKGVPTEAQVKSAPSGKGWSGKKSSGDPWGLTKNGPESFNTMC